MHRRSIIVAFVIAVLVGFPAGAKKKKQPPAGVIAASVAEQVVLADPSGQWTRSFGTGTVGWLFPAPGGVLFAPDLTRGRTTVLDLLGLREVELLDGVTMPHFGPSPDRYMVVAGDVMVVSYPERAVLDSFAADIQHPWQVLPISDTALLVLERKPGGEGGSSLVGVDLIGHQVVSRQALPGDVRRIALSTTLGLLAIADAKSQSVSVLDPKSMAPVMVFAVGGSPLSVEFSADGKALLAVVDEAQGVGRVRGWAFKVKKGVIEVKREVSVPLSAVPVAMAVWPLGPKVAVGLSSARIEVVDLEEEVVAASVKLPAEPRDVVWCDTTVEGPSVPEWSDDEPPELYIGNTERK
jgi:hypothetical protein